MDFRYLNSSDEEQLEDLISLVEANLPNEKWWVPIRPVIREHFFDPKWIRFIGCFDGDRLVAVGGLFLNEEAFRTSAEAAGLDPSVVAEVGRCMVRPTRRGGNLMLSVSQQLRDCARVHGKEWLIAAVHPDNAAGRKSLERLGMEEKGEVVEPGGYPRVVYAMPL